MPITELYLTLVKTPNIPKVYREIRQYYLDHGMVEEANAFAELIYEKFQQDVRFYDPHSDSNTQQ